MMNLGARLARLEGAARDGMMQVVVHGGLAGAGPDDHAHADGHAWRRTEGETVAAFRDRVLAGAKALRAGCVVWGGLPD